jgi:hypothetical protein
MATASGTIIAAVAVLESHMDRNALCGVKGKGVRLTV